jgi:hypothetical protein
MAHYALIDGDGIVQQVIVGRDENDLPDGIDDWESYYGAQFGMVCKRTSYNTLDNQHALGGTPFRGNYAGRGHTYDAERDVFLPPQPYPSWTLNETTFQWVAPVPFPDDGESYDWDESALNWTPATLGD